MSGTAHCIVHVVCLSVCKRDVQISHAQHAQDVGRVVAADLQLRLWISCPNFLNDLGQHAFREQVRDSESDDLQAGFVSSFRNDRVVDRQQLPSRFQNLHPGLRQIDASQLTVDDFTTDDDFQLSDLLKYGRLGELEQLRCLRNAAEFADRDQRSQQFGRKICLDTLGKHCSPQVLRPAMLRSTAIRPPR
jgi:hypothetical protein